MLINLIKNVILRALSFFLFPQFVIATIAKLAVRCARGGGRFSSEIEMRTNDPATWRGKLRWKRICLNKRWSYDSIHHREKLFLEFMFCFSPATPRKILWLGAWKSKESEARIDVSSSTPYCLIIIYENNFSLIRAGFSANLKSTRVEMLRVLLLFVCLQ